MTVYGPWLLDVAQLRELDKVLLNVWDGLCQYREKAIRRDVREILDERRSRGLQLVNGDEEDEELLESITKQVSRNSSNFREAKEITLFLNGERKLKVDSFEEALDHAAVSDTKAYGFIASMEVKDIEVSLIFDGNYSKVALKVSPERLPESRAAFALLKNWIDSNQPRKWQQHWLTLVSLMWALLILGCFGCVSFYTFLAGTPPSPYRTQAAELLKQGVTVTNQLKAVETILALQSGASPAGVYRAIPVWWFAAFGLGFVACSFFSVQAKPNLAIGKGETLVKRWRWWVKFITVGVPSFVFASFISPWLVSFIKTLFH
jgi:hypothetical protein